MLPPFDWFEHYRAWLDLLYPNSFFCWLTLASQRKQHERVRRIANLPAGYHSPVNAQELSILNASIENLVQDIHKHTLKPIDILRTYSKIALRAHEKTNCLTEVMLPDAEHWAAKEINLEGPLAGIPVSLKDSIAVGGFDASVGYSSNTGKPCKEDGSMVRILKAAGNAVHRAIPDPGC